MRRKAVPQPMEFSQSLASPRRRQSHAKARAGTMTFPVALHCDRVTAPCVVDGPINGASFQTYVGVTP